jgi:hypothetical protein
MCKKLFLLFALATFAFLFQEQIFSQGVTTASMYGLVQDSEGNPLPGANVIAEHTPSGTQYGASTRDNGIFNLPNLRVGGPYTITVSFVGFNPVSQENIQLTLGQNFRLEFTLQSEAVEIGEIVVSAEQDEVLNSNRTGAETFITEDDIKVLPTIKRTTRDLIRLDPRSDGNYSFGGKNWLYNNISVDGSYFNNPFGLDDPAPGGQTAAEPIPYDAIEQVQVSIAPFDVTRGGFTGAGVNTVTKSGSNVWRGSLYGFGRNETFVGNKVDGNDVIANPSLNYYQTGFSASGPIVPNSFFFFINAEVERREDPGSNFIANRSGSVDFGESRVMAEDMNRIRNIMRDVYGYETGPYENYVHKTENEKILVKFNWNINENNDFSFRYNRLDARRDLPPHPFVLSNGGRGPNETSLPFQNSGYRINNRLNSFSLELNSRGQSFANRFFASYNRFRDYRDPFSEPFPTIQIDVGGVNYTTIGHEPFSIHNILDQDVLQITDNLTFFVGDEVITVGATFEYFEFFNSFNIFRHGVFFLPDFLDFLGGAQFFSLEDFYARTDPNDPDNFYDFRTVVTPSTEPFKGEIIEVAQLSLYAQDEFLFSPQFNLVLGLRVDIPMYLTDPVDNPFSRDLTLLDEKGQPETVDQSKLAGAIPLWSPRIGFNWDVTGTRTTQVRGGTGIFTGRIPFVWVGNVISNPGNNPNLYPNVEEQIITKDDAILQTSFDLNAMDRYFVWPQVWNTNIALDQMLPSNFIFTLELLYGKDLNGIYVRNADLAPPIRTLPDGRPYYGGDLPTGDGVHELNPDGKAGVYVIDNATKGYHYNITAQLRKRFDFGLNTGIAYTFMEAKSLLKSTEIASVLWQENPTQGNPNTPTLSYSEFGVRHRFIGNATYSHRWNENFTSHFGLFFEVSEGNRFIGAGGNRYSFLYAGDVNGDGYSNDLIYIPRDQSEINLAAYEDANGNTVTAGEQWTALNAFIEQDDYLKEHRGEIAERFGAVNPWWWNIDFKFMQDFNFKLGNMIHTFQLSLDILNVPSLFGIGGVRKVASSSATKPLELIEFNSEGEPVFKFDTDLKETYIDDPGISSRWQMQLGLRYFFSSL